MASEIISIFDSPDTAEIALTRLREQNIPLISYRVKYSGGGIYGYADYSPYYSNSNSLVGSTWGWPQSMQNNTQATPILRNPAAGQGTEGFNSEVTLYVLADSGFASKVKSSLISSHGRRVRSI